MEHLTHWKNQFNYDYLGAYSLSDGKDIVLTIKETKKEMVTGANGQKSECFVAYFHENVKPMILNKTNCKAIEKMYKTHKRAVMGTGLGLSIVKNILELHHAGYGVVSEPGCGSTFWFELKIER